MSQSEDEAMEDETEWRSSLVDSLSVSPGNTTTGKVKAKGVVVLWSLVMCFREKLETGLCFEAASMCSNS